MITTGRGRLPARRHPRGRRRRRLRHGLGWALVTLAAGALLVDLMLLARGLLAR